MPLHWLRRLADRIFTDRAQGRRRLAPRPLHCRPVAELLEDRTLLASMLQFSQATQGVSENMNSASVAVTRIGDTSTLVTVRFTTTNGTATAGADYTAASGTLTFAPGETSRTFVVPVQADAIVEGTESVSLALSNPGGDAQLGTTSTATLFIADTVPATVPDEMLRVAYLIPSNRSPQPSAIANLQYAVRQYQAWYREQMERYGFGPKSFVYEAQADGVTPVVYMVFVAPTDDSLRGATTNELYNNNIAAARAAGVPVLNTPGQVWLLTSESHLLNADGSLVGGIALGASFGSGSDPGVGQIGSNSLSLYNPASLYDTRPYDGLIIPEVGPYPLRFGVTFASFTGTTVSNITSSGMGAALHEFSHGFGLPHDFRNDQNLHGNLMGNGFRGFRNEVFPTLFPGDETRLTYAEALTVNVSRYFNPALVVTDTIRPTISVLTSGSVDPENGLVRIEFTASDAGGLAVAVLKLNGEAIGELNLSSGSVSSAFLTPHYTPGQANNYTISAYDQQGNRQNASFSLTPSTGFNRAPRPNFKLLSSTVETGQLLTLDASTSNDSDHAASMLSVEWDLDGDGAFDTSPTTTKTLTQSFATVGTRLIYLRVTDPAGAQTVSTPLALRVTPPNTPPTISDLADRSIDMNTSTGVVPFTVGDAESLAEALLVSATTSNPALVPGANITFGGSGTSRSVTVAPASGQTGTALITLTVRDGHDTTATDSFMLTVVPGALRVTSLAPTSTGFTATFNRGLDTSVLNLYDTQTGGLGLADVSMTDSTGNLVRGSMLLSPDNRRITFVATGGVLTAGTYAVTLRGASNGFRAIAGGDALDGDDNGTPGGDFQTTITIPPSSAVLISVPDFVRGPGQAVHVPATSTGLPLRLASSAGVTSVDVTLRYDARLLTITAADVAPGLPDDAVVTLDASTPGVAVIRFSSSALPDGVSDFVRLSAIVPETAGSLYTQKQLLDLTRISINEGALSGLDDDSVHIASYLGDTSGNGGYSSADALRALRVAVGLDSGFLAYQLADPLLLADVTGNGRLNATDANRILQEALGLDRLEIPALPPNPPALTVSGPDPLLRIPRRLRGRPGSIVRVPVLLDRSAGLESADLALSYDARRLEVNEVQRGSLTADFDLFAAHIDPSAGTVRVGLGRSAGAIADRGSGGVLQVVFRIRPDAPRGATFINLRQRLGTTTTQLNEGGLDLNPDPSDQAGDNLDGVITIMQRRRPRKSIDGVDDALRV